MPYETPGPYAGLESGLQGFMQAKEANVKTQGEQIDNQAKEQTMASAPMLLLQQRLKMGGSPTDPQLVAAYNHYGKMWGLPPADPAKGIDPNFAKYDLMPIVNPEAWAAKQAETQNRISQMIYNLPKLPGDPLANLHSTAIAIQNSGGDPSQLLSLASDPTWQNGVTAFYQKKLAQIGANIGFKGAQANDYNALAKKWSMLAPLQGQEIIAQTTHLGYEDQNIKSQIATRAANVQNAINKLQIAQTQGAQKFQIAIMQLGQHGAELNEKQRHNYATEAQSYLNNQRALVQGILTSAGPQPSAELLKQITDALTSDDGISGLSDKMAKADALYQQTMANLPPVKNPTLPSNTQQSPRNAGSHTPYVAGHRYYIMSGPNAGKVVGRNGKIGTPSGGNVKWKGQYVNSPSDVLKPAP